MSIRALWIIPVPQKTNQDTLENNHLIFTRVFPLVEKKLKFKTVEVKSTPLPSATEFSNGLLFELGYKDEEEKFIQSRDTCQKLERKPVYEVTTSAGVLWPVVVVEQRGLLFCCLPHVDCHGGSANRPGLIEIPGVSLGFSLLCGLADFLRQCSPSDLTQKSAELYMYFNTASPFGKIIDVNPDTIMAKMYNKPSYLPKTQKQPAWKPVIHKGKNSLYLAVTEYIRAVQYEKEGTPDAFDLYGTVSCKADLENSLSDITINLAYTTQESIFPLDHLLIHPCVQSADSSIIQKGTGETRAAPRRIRFTPLTEMFTLCNYTVSSLTAVPIKGVYDMKMDGSKAFLRIQLTLNEKVKNSFEYCELQIPFYNRGVISAHDASVTQGNTLISPDKKLLVWNIGQKFSPKTLSAKLEATVTFTESKTPSSYDDPFCKDQNAYALLFFKIMDFTHSGCCIDSKSIQVSPNTKFKLTTVHEYLSAEYKIWNVNGDVLTSFVPTSLLQEPQL